MTIVGGAVLTVMVTVADAVFGVDPVSLTVTVAGAARPVVGVVGVPLIVSVAPLPLAVSPAGSPETAPQV